MYDIASYQATTPKDVEELQREPAELAAEHVVRELDATEPTFDPADEEAKQASRKFQGFVQTGT